jgi:hypothetical protein
VTFRSGCMLKRGACASQAERTVDHLGLIGRHIRSRSFVRYQLITLRQTNAEYSLHHERLDHAKRLRKLESR